MSDNPVKKDAQDATTVIDELRSKIHSKMDVSKFFAAFITLLIGFLLDRGGASFLSSAGLILIIASLALCVASVFAYDVLLVPRKFWGRSPDTITKDQYINRLWKTMIQSWWYLFLPAVSCFGVGLFLTIIDVLWRDTLQLPTGCFAILVILLILSIVAPPVIYRWKGPRIYE